MAHLLQLPFAAVLQASCLGAWAAEPPFVFLVRAQPGDAAPRCEPASRGRCRDDLSLPQVFEALAKIATQTGPSPFTERPVGQPALEVELGPGTFRLARPLALQAWPGASPYGRLTLSGAADGKTVLSGATAVPASAWRAVAQTETRLTASARPHVRVASLPAISGSPARTATAFGEAVVPLQLDVLAAGRPMTLARWPNTGWAQTTVAGLARAEARTDTPARAITIHKSNGRAWADEPDLTVAGYFLHDWAFERIPVHSVNAASGELMLLGPGTKFGVRGGQRVFVENALVELDAPGEWYFDARRKLLFFWPPDGVELAAVEVALTPGLVNMSKCAGVTLRQMTLQATTGDAIVANHSSDIVLADLSLRAIGNRGVWVEGGSAVLLSRLDMADLGDGGVLFSGGDRRTLAPGGHRLEDSSIQRFSRYSRSYRPAVTLYGVGHRVMRNRIFDGPHAAIVFDGNDHRIEGNHISDVVTESNDAGAIYTGRDWSARGTVITNNLLQNIYPRLPGTHSVKGIYLDDQASGTTISRNVFANVTRAVFIGGGRDNIVEHNLFVAGSPAIFADGRGQTWQQQQVQDEGGELRRRLHNVPYAAEPYRTRYPNLARLLDDEPGRIKYNRIKGNLFVAAHDFEFLDQAHTGIEIADNHKLPWTAFKALRGPKPVYAPADFELLESALPAPRSSFVQLGAITPQQR